MSQKVTTAGASAVPVKTETFTYTAAAGGTSTQVATHKIVSGSMNTTYSYTYDDNGNILEVYDGSFIISYVYDSANQLVRENNQKYSYTKTWTYDNAGNITSRKEYSYTTGDLEDAILTDTVTYGYPEVPTPVEDAENPENAENTESTGAVENTGNPVWGDLLTSYDGEAITYETTESNGTFGNPLNGNGRTYTWEHGRQLSSLTKGNTKWEYEYNADGMRTKRTLKTDGTNVTKTYEYTYSGSQLTQMRVDSDVYDFTYDANGIPLTLTKTDNTNPNNPETKTYYYITNLQGDVLGLRDSTREWAAYTYDAWGKCEGIIGESIESENPLRYRGYVYDVETQLYYLQSRYYDPEVGRFLNADGFTSTGQGFIGNNMFAYCGNDPVSYYDPTGMLHDMHGGGGCLYNRKGQNIENMMKFFNVSSADELPPLPDNAMVVAENVSVLPTPLGCSFVYGRSIVMDEDRYCEYTFSGYAYGKGFPVDRYDTVGYVYGVEAVSDYEGLFFGGSVNLIADIQGGAVAPNKVWSEVIGGNGFIFASAGVSITNYTASSTDWVYGKANVRWYVSPHARRYNPKM